MKVHSELGPGFTEPVYQEALEKQFIRDNIPYEREKLLSVFYDGEKLKKHFVADFVCFKQIIVELKALPFIHGNDVRQLRNYLKTSHLSLGIVVNFGEPSLSYKRIINIPPAVT